MDSWAHGEIFALAWRFFPLVRFLLADEKDMEMKILEYSGWFLQMRPADVAPEFELAWGGGVVSACVAGAFKAVGRRWGLRAEAVVSGRRGCLGPRGGPLGSNWPIWPI